MSPSTQDMQRIPRKDMTQGIYISPRKTCGILRAGHVARPTQGIKNWGAATTGDT